VPRTPVNHLSSRLLGSNDGELIFPVLSIDDVTFLVRITGMFSL